MQCIAKACPNHDNVILSFVLSRSFFFLHFSCFINHHLENRYAESGRERVRERPFYFNGGGGGETFSEKKIQAPFFSKAG